MFSAAVDRRVRRTIGTSALVAGLVVASAGVAQASQSDVLGPNRGATYSTWFWGRTQVCVKDLDVKNNVSYTWVSSTSSDAGGLYPGQEICFTKSFVGFKIYIKNVSPEGNLQVRFPIGP